MKIGETITTEAGADRIGPSGGEAGARRAVADRGRANGFAEGKKTIVLISLLGALLIMAAVSVTSGAYNIKTFDVVKTVSAHIIPFRDAPKINKLHNTIIWNIRLPRILLAVCVGAALSTAGVVFQGCFRNPLVEPYILGASQGAAFGAGLGMVFPQFALSIQVGAFVFSLLAVFSAYTLARVRGETPVITLILAGVIIASVFSALVSILKYVAADSALRGIVFWMMGGFYYATWADVRLILPIGCVCFACLWSMGWKLNILSMGDEEARALGVNPEKFKLILIFLATLSTSLAVSAVGIIAWVGLMTPHATRLMLGPDNRYVLPAAALLGGIYLIFCDTLARTLTSAEIPVGILTSLVGAPYLFYLLRTKGRSLMG